ncbi:MAG: hypothetical protein IJ191_06255 [Treponema sp.]|nr:hypothetical protein [Treponema sp.]
MNRENVKKIGIIGTGMIGTSVAVLTTSHGFDTVVLAVNEELRQTSEKQYDKYLDDLKDQACINEGQIAYCKQQLSYSLEYSALAACDVIFEAVVEKVDVKHEVLQKIEASCPNVRAICSVSSALEVDVMAEKMTKYKDRLVVTHPFFPPHLVPYFEIAGGSATDESVKTFAKTLLEDLDRKPVIMKKSAPGFIGNRLQFALWREAVNIVEQGIARPEDVDTCLLYSFCPRYSHIGLFEHMDNGGLDLNYNVSKTIFPTLSNETGVPALVSRLVEESNLGVKTGKGVYDWSQKDMTDFKQRVGAPYWKFFNWEIPSV